MELVGLAMLWTSIPQLPGDESMHLYRDVFSVLSRSCKIMEVCSG